MSDKAIRTMTGMVVSCNSDKTAVAKIDRKVKHPKLGKCTASLWSSGKCCSNVRNIKSRR